MKNTLKILTTLTLSVLVISCGKKENSASSGKGDKQAEVTQSSIPKFSDKKITTFAEKYVEFCDDYEKLMDEIAAGKTPGNAQEFMTKAQDLQQQALKLQGEIKGKDLEKFNKFAEEQSQRILAALQKMQGAAQ